MSQQLIEDETEVVVSETREGSQIREYHVFQEMADGSFKKLETVTCSSPDIAIKQVNPDANKRYAVVAARYWQVGKPTVKQITQVTIEFE